MGAITVVTSGKGGVGKSTVTAQLGRALALRGSRVLLVDGDAGLRCLDLLLGVSSSLVFDMSDVVRGNCEPIRAIYEVGDTPGLWLLPAPQSWEKRLPPRIMNQLVTMLGHYYDHVIVDSPAGIDEGFQAACAPAQRALVITQCTPVCLRSCEHVHRLLLEQGVDQQRLIINRFSYAAFRRQEDFEDLDSVIDAAGIRLAGIVPEDGLLAMHGSCRELLQRKSHGFSAIERIAARLEGEAVPLGSLRRF